MLLHLYAFVFFLRAVAYVCVCVFLHAIAYVLDPFECFCVIELARLCGIAIDFWLCSKMTEKNKFFSIDLRVSQISIAKIRKCFNRY